MIYAIVLTNFNVQTNVKVQKFENLKDNFEKFHQKDKKVDFYIYDNCSKSAIFINDIYNSELDINIDIESFEKIKVFKTNRMAEAKEIKFSPVLLENKLKDVCFQFTIYPNGSSSSYIVEQDKKFYIFFPYFENTKAVNNLEEAKDLYMHSEHRVSAENLNEKK